MPTNWVRRAFDWLLLTVAIAAGGKLYVIGSTFAQWSAHHTNEYYFNLHAELLTSGGISLVALSLLVARLMQRLHDLEQGGKSPQNRWS